MNRSAAARAVLALVGLAGVPACHGERKGDRPEALIIALSPSVHAALAHIAAAKGFFAEEGLAPTLQRHEFGRVALASVVAGTADLAACAETPVVFATLRGERPVFVATIATSAKANAIVARRSAGITNPGDLARMRVGVPFGTAGAFFLDTFLLRHRLDRELVEYVDLSPEQISDALANKQVDAVAIWNPLVLALQRRLGNEVVTFQADDVSWETHGLATRPELVRDRGSALRKALRALERAEVFAREQPQEARRLVAAATNTDPADLERMWNDFQFRVSLEQGLLALMEEEARWAMRAGLVPKQMLPNFSAAIAPEPLLAVNPGAVRLIR